MPFFFFNLRVVLGSCIRQVVLYSRKWSLTFNSCSDFLFLLGIYIVSAGPLVTIESENAKTDKELIIFRDSFSSSIAPLFTGAYKKVTLIDLRYMPSMLLNEFVEFKAGQDVLFLYSASLYNSSMLLK